MSEHRFEPTMQCCIGCGIAARHAIDAPAPDCPAFYAPITNGGQHFTAVISTDEHLRVMRDGVLVLDFDPHAMFALRDAVDEGAAKLRAHL